MARVLGGDRNELRLTDNLSSSEIVLYYRMPAASERLAYSAMAVKRRGDKIQFKHQEARQKYGDIILTGFRAGDFRRMKDGQEVPISTDGASPDYFEGWRELINKYAPDALEALATFVFDASVTKAPDEEKPDPADQPDKSDQPAPDDASGN